MFSPDVSEAVVSYNSFCILLCAIKNEWKEDLEFHVFCEHWQIVRGYKLFLAALEFNVKIKNRGLVGLIFFPFKMSV